MLKGYLAIWQWYLVHDTHSIRQWRITMNGYNLISDSLSSPLSDDSIEEIFCEIRRKFEMKPHVAIAGFGKAGKSSLFNAIYGKKVAKVSMRTDETTEIQTRERFGIDFTDTPGIGTGKFSFEKVCQMGVFDRQHVVIHVLNGASAISEEDEQLHDLLSQSTAKRVTVVNKVDILDQQEQQEYAESIQEKLGLFPNDFFFVSAKTGDGMLPLIYHITDILPDAMKDAFIAQQNADITIKQKRVRTLIYSKASLCGAAAVIPIPIADIFVITPIQVAMITAIGYFYDVEMSKERALELIGTIGAGVGLREAARQLIKLIPGYGQVVSASIAFAGTVALGEAANLWFKNKMKVDIDELQGVFKQIAEKARQNYPDYSKNQNALKEKIDQLREQLTIGNISQQEFERRLAELDNL